MRRVNFNDEKFQEVTVKGISCMFSDGRIDRDTVPDGLYLYEVAGDDDIGDEPSRVRMVMSNIKLKTVFCLIKMAMK